MATSCADLRVGMRATPPRLVRDPDGGALDEGSARTVVDRIAHCPFCEEMHLRQSRFSDPAALDRRLTYLTLLCRGLTQTEIAEELGMTIRAVHTCLQSIRAQFGARSRTHLVAIVVGLGLVPPEDFADPVTDGRSCRT